jgi:heavy metal sensor kinase
MRSIRLSLIVYFLLLLGVALGAVSFLVYETTRQSLEEKEQSMGRLLRDRHQAKLDDMLLREARNLVSHVQLSFKPAFPKTAPPKVGALELQILGVLAAGPSRQGHLAIPLWLLQKPVSPLPKSKAGAPLRDPEPAPRTMREVLHLVSFNVGIKDVETPDPEGRLADFYQVSNGYRVLWGSPSLKGTLLPVKPAEFAGDSPVAWKFQDTKVGGSPIRLVTFRVPRYPLGEPWWGRRPPGMKGPAAELMRHLNFTPEPRTQSLYVQGAYDTANKNSVLGHIEQELAGDLAQLSGTTQATLTSLRQSLWLFGLITFGLTFVGGFVLVRVGLLPLHRVSEAVSKVSEKDFRLPLEDQRLPTELWPIVERLKQTLEMLRRAFDREKQAAADISHDLRTPLAALMTTLDIALRKPRTAEEYREVLEECRASGQHMYALVERLLTLARLDAGVDRLRTKDVDVVALAEQCASMVQPLAEARGLRLRFHKDGPASMAADPDKLREVFTNLLHNAIEYNRPDGSIDLAVAHDNGDVRVEVRDTGIGIGAEARQHIFERFYRADPSRGTEGLHAGLGLAIVKGYIDLMGGSIDVDSALGQGSTFRVRLPVKAS